MTTYHLRTASPAKTRCDAVVVGVIASGQSGQGLRLADGGEDVADGLRAQVAAAALHARRHRQGRRGRQGADRGRAVVTAAGARRAGRARPRGPSAVRRAAGGGRSRAVSNAASVAARPAGRLAGAGAGGDRGLRARRLHVHRLQAAAARTTPRGAGEVVVLSADRPAAGRDRRRCEEAQHRRRGGRGDARDWVNTAARRPAPAGVRRRGRGARARSSAAASRSRSGPTTRRRSPTLGCGGILGVGEGSARAAAAGRADLRARRRRSPTSRWSARASPSTPAA